MSHNMWPKRATPDIAAPVAALADPTGNGLGQPLATPIGRFGGIAYVQFDGIFQGQTSTGAFRVPYRITAPANSQQGNRTVLVEPPHFDVGLGALNVYLLRELLFPAGFAHAGVGWSTGTFFPGGGAFRILDPTVPGIFINGGFEDINGRTDDEIIVEFARALVADPNAQQMLGRVDRRYVAGFGDSSDPVLRLITSGAAAGLFDYALAFLLDAPHDPQTTLAAGGFAGKLIVVNSEFEGTSADVVDRGVAPDRYRFYAVAGTPLVADVAGLTREDKTSPASYQPALRAHFLQGDNWVKTGQEPPPSTRLKTSDGVTLDRDANGNALSVDGNGHAAPRLPILELGEAHFIAGFNGSFDAVKTLADLGFRNHGQYLKAFKDKLDDYARAGYIIPQDADDMRRRAGLCPPHSTFTQTYRDHYDQFIKIVPCTG